MARGKHLKMNETHHEKVDREEDKRMEKVI